MTFAVVVVMTQMMMVVVMMVMGFLQMKMSHVRVGRRGAEQEATARSIRAWHRGHGGHRCVAQHARSFRRKLLDLMLVVEHVESSIVVAFDHTTRVVVVDVDFGRGHVDEVRTGSSCGSSR